MPKRKASWQQTMEPKEVASRLQSVQWDFQNSSTRMGIHGLHPYPAKFIPEIPRALIRLFPPKENTAILDPFCGSGTTLVEAASVGIRSVGIDLNPLAALIAKVKTTPLAESIEPYGKLICRDAQTSLQRDNIRIPVIPNLDHWFLKPVQEALAALISQINALPDQNVADALRVAFSSIVVRVSNQDSDTRYAAVAKSVTQEDVWLQFERAVSNTSAMLDSIAPNLFAASSAVQIINSDLMRVEPQEIEAPVGLVVTSPPYPNAYEYWLYHKYRMFWLGMNPVAIREHEIGARPHYFKKNHQTEADFEQQMARCFRLLSQVMRPSAYACFVVGRSIIHGREVDNEALLARAASRNGFSQAGIAHRAIAAHRKSFNPAHGKINREGIIVFQREAT